MYIRPVRSAINGYYAYGGIISRMVKNFAEFFGLSNGFVRPVDFAGRGSKEGIRLQEIRLYSDRYGTPFKREVKYELSDNVNL